MLSTPSHAYTTPGTYTVILTVTAPLLNAEGDTVCCCQDTYAMDIEVLDEKGPDIECISTLCEGDSACYWTTSGCSGATYIWTALPMPMATTSPSQVQDSPGNLPPMGPGALW